MASQKVNEVIQLLKSNQKVSPLYVPSLKRDVSFKHLTAGQQEKFVQALVDNPAVQARFISTLIGIIKENCEEKSIVNQFTIIDRYAIGLGLRAVSVGEIVKTEVESESGVTYIIDLKNNLEYIKTKTEHVVLDDIDIDNFHFTLQYPTITQEANNESYFKQSDSSFEPSVDSIRSMISNAFIGDVAMFLKALSIKRESGEPVTIDLNATTLQDKLELIRSLPNTVLEKMLDPMAAVKSQIEGILKSVGTAETDEKLKRSILIGFDASLFIASN